MLLLLSIVAYVLMSTSMLIAGLIRHVIDKPIRYVIINVMVALMLFIAVAISAKTFHIQTMFSYCVCGLSIGFMFTVASHVVYAFTLPDDLDDMLQRIERDEI